MIEHGHDIDHLADLVDPEKSLVRKLGILGIETSGKIAQLLGDASRVEWCPVRRQANPRAGHLHAQSPFEEV